MNPTKMAVVALVVALVGTVAVGGGAAHSASDGDREAQKEVRIIDEEIVIADGVVTISDTTLNGPGLGERTIEDDEYTVDSTVRFDGFHITHGDTHYTICRVSITIEDIGVRLQNVTLTEGGEESSDEPTESSDEPTESSDEPTESNDEPTETTETSDESTEPTETREEPTETSDESTEDCGCLHVEGSARAD